MSLTKPHFLWHTTLTIIDYRNDSSGATREFHVLGTFGTLASATASTQLVLLKLGFPLDYFMEFSSRSPGGTVTGGWRHGSVCVFARARTRQVFLVDIQSVLNDDNAALRYDELTADSDGIIVLPRGIECLHYVVQTKVFFQVDRSGSLQDHRIVGACFHRADAEKVAMECLDAEPFVQYDLRQGAEMAGRPWPFGDEIVVHAVSESGETHFVAVKREPWVSGGHERIVREHAGVPRDA